MQVQANLVLPTQTCPPVIFLQAEMEACTLSQYGFIFTEEFLSKSPGLFTLTVYIPRFRQTAYDDIH